jgi:hypothetical protein
MRIPFSSRILPDLIAMGISIATLLIEPALAGNMHEHLQYQPRFEDILKGTNGELGKYPASSLIRRDGNFISNFDARFGPKLFSDDEWKKMVKTETFEGLCQKIAEHPRMKKRGITAKKAMESFYSLEKWHPNPKNSYLAASSMRNNLFFKIDGNHSILKKSIENNLKNSRIWQNSKTVFTVPQELADPKTLNDIANIYKKNGYMTENLLSFTRDALSKYDDQAFQDLIIKLENGVNEGWLHGADVSGSIYESAKQKSTNSRLKQLFEKSAQLDSSLRIHSFEETNHGQFYDEFWDALESSAKSGKVPKSVRIGHIHNLGILDIQRFGKLKDKVNFLFEANLESNLTLNKSKVEKLVRTIEYIHKSGMNVALGSDGAGILGVRSNHSLSFARLMEAGMTEDSIERLVQESKTPLPNQKWDPDFYQKLSDNTDDLLKKLKRSSKRSRNSCENWVNNAIHEIFIPIP